MSIRVVREVRMHDMAILATIQQSQVPTFNSAENSYFGLAAEKG